MPYIQPDPDNACETCVNMQGDCACEGCKCYDPRFMQHGFLAACTDADHTWEAGYHWRPAEWECNHCKRRDFVGHRDPVLRAASVMLCDDCTQTVLRGLEALRKAGLAVYGKGQCHQSDAQADGTQTAADFYGRLAAMGGED